MSGVCDMCGESFEDTHTCRVVRGDTVWVIRISLPIPYLTKADLDYVHEFLVKKGIV